MRYFFDVQSPALYTPDREGCQFDSPLKMRAEALRVLAAIAGEEGAGQSHFVLTVRDEAGRPVYRVRASFEHELLAEEALAGP